MTNEKMNKKNFAYEEIRGRILSGIYAPGQRIVIDQIAKELKLSIIPVREAIRQLEADGLVHNKPYSGPIVNTINEKEYLETLSVLAVLEGYATALSAANLTRANIEELKKINQEMEDALIDFEFEQFGDLNRKFHGIILAACGNTYLEDEIKRVSERMDSVRRSVFNVLSSRTKYSFKEHNELIELIETKAPFAQIEEYAREHKMNTVKAFQKREQESTREQTGRI